MCNAHTKVADDADICRHIIDTLLIKSVMLFVRIGYIKIQRKSHIKYANSSF